MLKYEQNSKGPRIVKATSQKTNLEHLDQLLASLTIKLQSSGECGFRYKNQSAYSQNKIESPELDPYLHGH